MNKLRFLVLPLAMLIPLVALADKGKGKKHKREHMEAYWDGNCKVERKYKGNGQVKVKRKCKGGDDGDYRYQDHERTVYRDDRRDYRDPRPAVVISVPQRVYRPVAPVVRVEPAPRVYREVAPKPVYSNDPYSNLK
ncbi:MAG: hypothetical protein WKG03_17600 [Telluria sp.]